ncbi:hypothetical protein WG66_006205 [Moniliophthora roreri]|nr:hypothetical protein WG66_006205 [Moniliophthora roreri]
MGLGLLVLFRVFSFYTAGRISYDGVFGPRVQSRASRNRKSSPSGVLWPRAKLDELQSTFELAIRNKKIMTCERVNDHATSSGADLVRCRLEVVEDTFRRLSGSEPYATNPNPIAPHEDFAYTSRTVPNSRSFASQHVLTCQHDQTGAYVKHKCVNDGKIIPNNFKSKITNKMTQLGRNIAESTKNASSKLFDITRAILNSLSKREKNIDHRPKEPQKQTSGSGKESFLNKRVKQHEDAKSEPAATKTRASTNKGDKENSVVEEKVKASSINTEVGITLEPSEPLTASRNSTKLTHTQSQCFDEIEVPREEPQRQPQRKKRNN